MQVCLKRITIKDRVIFEHLWDLYSYDFSLYNNEDVMPQGSYDFYYSDDFFESDSKACFFIMADGNIAGFVSCSSSCYLLTGGDDRCIVDFFVMNKYRKGGVGRKAAYLIFDSYKTNWEVVQYDNNEISKKFWESVINDYTNSHYEKRSIFQRDFSLVALVFNSVNDGQENLYEILKKMDDDHQIYVYSRPNEDIINELIQIARNSYNTLDDVYLSIRRDLKYQDVIIIRNDDEIKGFLVFTSIDGDAEITFCALKRRYQKAGIGTLLLRSFVQHMRLNGFDRITVDFDTVDKRDQLKGLNDFYLNFGFKKVEGREELIEYNINNL